MDQNREPRQDSTSRKRGRALALTILGIIVVVAISSVAADLLRSRSLRIDPTDRPIEVDADGYVSSDNCRSCHPAEYHSWYNSYHRTMTQPANPDTVKGDFNDVALELDGIQYRMQREGDRFYLKIVGEASRHEIVMVTGSHHMQVYWYSTGEQRLLSQNPFTYYMGVGWVPFRSVFVRPPEEHRPVLVQHYGTGRWNDTCLNCHTTHGRPRMGFDGTFDTEVAEFGIACESCHGPSEEHIRVNRSPLRRYAQYFEEITDPTITQPNALAKKPASEVCAHCHGIFQFRDVDAVRSWKKSGFDYRPGDTHEKDQYLFQPSLAGEEPMVDQIVKNDKELVRNYFWADGRARSSAREYNDMIETGCYKRGDLTCMSCHSMHQPLDDERSVKTWANDQLSPRMDGDQACLQCHGSFVEDIAAHTHHREDSTGSSCYNCHMPYTDWGLMKSQREHKIDSPTVAESVHTGRPNACNLCHLDKTMAWTAGHLDSWYNIESPALGDDERNIAGSVLWALRGDPGVRAMIADAMGRPAAREASNGAWTAPILGVLMDDPYDAVRHVAARSLQRFQGFENFEFDYVVRPHNREPVRPIILERFLRNLPEAKITEQMLLTPRGTLIDAEVSRLVRQRDARPFVLYE